MVSRALQHSEPAYSGARFDSKGMCIFHSDVRLCKLKDNGKFRIVKKTCFKCGTAGLIPKDCHKAKTHVHGYKAKEVPKRQQLADKLQGLSSHNLVDPKTDVPRPLESKDSKGRPRRQKKIQTRGETTSRSRTLSPPRPKAQRSPKPTASPGKARRDMSNDLEYRIPPLPPFTTTQTGMDLTPTSRKHGNAGASLEVQKIFNGFGLGHCSVHPHVKLAIIRTARGDGSWDIKKESCPLCSDARGRSEEPGDNAPAPRLRTASESSPRPGGTAFVRCSSGPSAAKPLALAPQSPTGVTDVSTSLAHAPLRNSKTRIANRKKNKEMADRESAPWPVSKHGD